MYLATNGCEVGQLYSMHVQEFFLKNNPDIVLTDDPEKADLIVLYGCGLTEIKRKDSVALVSKIRSKMKPSAKLVVWGCISKQSPESLASIYGDPLFGPSDLSFFEGIYERVTARTCLLPIGIADANIPLPSPAQKYGLRVLLKRPQERFRHFSLKNDYLLPTAYSYLNRFTDKALLNPIFYIRISEGCNSHCTYCSERLVWGKVKSRPIEKVLSEFENGLKKGYTRFFMCAEDLGAYGLDLGYNACDLLRRIIDVHEEKKFQIIINEMSPPFLKNNFSDFKEILSTRKIESVGCQVESGSNRILKLMGRHYKAEEWRQLMLHINQHFPDVYLATHFMVGFPSETEQDFRASLKLLDYPLVLNDITIFKFSSSWKVPASRLPNHISEPVKELRFRRIQSKFLHMYAINSIIKCGRVFARKPLARKNR